MTFGATEAPVIGSTLFSKATIGSGLWKFKDPHPHLSTLHSTDIFVYPVISGFGVINVNGVYDLAYGVKKLSKH